MKSLSQQLSAWKAQQDTVLIKTTLTPSQNRTNKGRHALRPYVAVVEFPISRGGGVTWTKSRSAANNYAAQGAAVIWLS